MNNKSKPKIQLSMFPQFVCEICGDKLEHHGTSCQECAKVWINKKIQQNDDK